MPELPEVETVVRDLRPLVVGRRLGRVGVSPASLRRPWDRAWDAPLHGAIVTLITRRGKWIQFHLDRPERLLVHLGMTGQLTVAPRDRPAPDHLHLWVGLDAGGDELRFRDPRRFGSADLFADETAVTAFLDARLGPEPFDLTAEALTVALEKTSRPIKAVLLDQKVVAGVGNIYADEALHRARIHPERSSRSLTAAEVGRLATVIPAVLTFAIECRGSTIRDYIGGSGLKGGFQNEFNVYGRTAEPCLTCATAIGVVRVAGRSSHFCPACQAGG